MGSVSLEPPATVAVNFPVSRSLYFHNELSFGMAGKIQLKKKPQYSRHDIGEVC